MTLQDDLLQDFKEQKRIIKLQIELFDPLATSLRQPAAQRLISKGGIIFAEFFCYLLCMAAIAFTIIMNLVIPFNLLSKLQFNPVYQEHLIQYGNLNLNEAQLLNITMHVLAGFIALLFFIMGRILRRIRLKNAILDLAANNIKALMGQHLNRKASIEAIEQRHFLELPEMRADEGVNLIPNPGYGE
jgi:hypothetical protein